MPASGAADRTRDDFEATLRSQLADPAFKADPYPTYDMIRSEPGWRSPSRFRVFGRYEDVHQILRQPTVFGQVTREQPSFHVMDPPEHTRLRGLVSRAFTPKSLSAQQQLITETASRLLDSLSSAGRMDFVRQYATPFPARVIAQMLGVPYEDGDRWNPWLEAIKESRGVVRYLEVDHDEVERSAANARRYGRLTADHLRSIMEERRNSRGDDIVSRLIEERDGDDSLSEDEVLFTLVLLLGAGLHTTTAQLGNILLALLRHPECIEQIRADPSLIGNAVEEGLRIDSSLQAEHRLVHEDTRVGDVALRAGEHVMILVGAANHDPDVFASPDDFQLTRPNAKSHLTFGFGIHRCLGAELARAELRAALSEVVLRLPGLRIDGAAKHYEYDRFRGLSVLEVAWDADAEH